jgi:hypothetical protein
MGIFQFLHFRNRIKHLSFVTIVIIVGVRGSVVVQALCYNVECRGFYSR